MDHLVALTMRDLAAGPKSQPLDVRMDRFLAGIERRALRISELATRERDEALDLVQDAMLRFVRNYRHHAEADWPPLFHRVLDNRIRDWQRRQRVRGHWLVRLFVHADDDESGNALEQVVDSAQVEPARVCADAHSLKAIDAALRSLPQRQRQVFALRMWEGLDTGTTARALGISEGSVKTHLFRALAALRSQLGDFDER